MAALLTAFLWPARAAAEPVGLPMVVLFDTPAGELPETEIRENIARELHRPVRTASEPDLPTLTVARGTGGEIVVRYHPPSSELERKVALPARGEHVPLLVALVAKNLVSSEARDLVAELGTGKSAAPTAPAPSIREPGSRFYLRLSLGGGYSAATYSANSGSTATTRGAAYEVGLSGADMGLHVAVGSMGPSGLAFGVEGGGGLFLLHQHGSLGSTRMNATLPVHLGGFVDYYPQARGPLHLQGGLAAAYVRFAYSGDDRLPSGVATAIDVNPLYGAMAYVGAGYDLGPHGIGGFGLFARTQFGFFADGNANLVPITLRLGLSMAWL